MPTGEFVQVFLCEISNFFLLKRRVDGTVDRVGLHSQHLHAVRPGQSYYLIYISNCITAHDTVMNCTTINTS